MCASNSKAPYGNPVGRLSLDRVCGVLTCRACRPSSCGLRTEPPAVGLSSSHFPRGTDSRDCLARASLSHFPRGTDSMQWLRNHRGDNTAIACTLQARLCSPCSLPWDTRMPSCRPTSSRVLLRRARHPLRRQLLPAPYLTCKPWPFLSARGSGYERYRALTCVFSISRFPDISRVP